MGKIYPLVGPYSLCPLLANQFSSSCGFCNSFIPNGNFFSLKFSAGVENSVLESSFLLSDWLSYSTRALKSSTFEM